MLTPIKKVKSQDKRTRWLYKCQCGEQKVIREDAVKGGATKSCGCLQKQFTKSGKANYKHGLSHTKFWRIFADIKRRTTDKARQDYDRYGGRGIKCEWENFQAFKEDMYDSYLLHKKNNGEDNTTIDRIDNNGNYNKKNCRWATYKEQANNTRRNKRLKYKGKNMTYTQWEEYLGLPKKTVSRRVRSGYKLETILSKKNYAGKHNIC